MIYYVLSFVGFIFCFDSYQLLHTIPFLRIRIAFLWILQAHLDVIEGFQRFILPLSIYLLIDYFNSFCFKMNSMVLMWNWFIYWRSVYFYDRLGILSSAANDGFETYYTSMWNTRLPWCSWVFSLVKLVVFFLIWFKNGLDYFLSRPFFLSNT